jgi:putative ABC transport system permease protein
VGVLTLEAHESDRFIVTNYGYLDEGRAEDRGTANVFTERIKDATQAGAIGKVIDNLFANSQAQTRTISERAEGLSNQNVTFSTKFFIETVTGASLFMLLFLTGNTMMQSVRQRIPELAVLKTVGFSGFTVLVLVFCEAALITLVGAALGLLIADTLMPLAKNMVGVASIRPVVFLEGALAALLIAVASGAPPAWTARRLSVADALATR